MEAALAELLATVFFDAVFLVADLFGEVFFARTFFAGAFFVAAFFATAFLLAAFFSGVFFEAVLVPVFFDAAFFAELPPALDRFEELEPAPPELAFFAAFEPLRECPLPWPPRSFS